VFNYQALALRRLPLSRQTSNASIDDLERQNDRSSPNSVRHFISHPGPRPSAAAQVHRRPLLDRRAGGDGSPLWTIATGERNMVEFTLTR
jgi:hypothetical protein